jgi:hypothetical protein
MGWAARWAACRPSRFACADQQKGQRAVSPVNGESLQSLCRGAIIWRLNNTRSATALEEIRRVKPPFALFH